MGTFAELKSYFLSIIYHIRILRKSCKAVLCAVLLSELNCRENQKGVLKMHSSLDLLACRITTNMASSSDVLVRICGQEIIKYDLEIKALIQVDFILYINVSVMVLLSGFSDKLTNVIVTERRGHNCRVCVRIDSCFFSLCVRI